MTKSPNKYNEHQDKGTCLVCGKTHHQTSIWKVFLETGWMRGDDEYLGKFCKQCRKEKAYELKNLLNLDLRTSP